MRNTWVIWVVPDVKIEAQYHGGHRAPDDQLGELGAGVIQDIVHGLEVDDVAEGAESFGVAVAALEVHHHRVQRIGQRAHHCQEEQSEHYP